MDFELKKSDALFCDSPDPGASCLCSRCMRPVMDVPIRLWPDSGGEYRFHPECLGFTTVRSSTFDDFDDL